MLIFIFYFYSILQVIPCDWGQGRVCRTRLPGFELCFVIEQLYVELYVYLGKDIYHIIINFLICKMRKIKPVKYLKSPLDSNEIISLNIIIL